MGPDLLICALGVYFAMYLLLFLLIDTRWIRQNGGLVADLPMRGNALLPLCRIVSGIKAQRRLVLHFRFAEYLLLCSTLLPEQGSHTTSATIIIAEQPLLVRQRHGNLTPPIQGSRTLEPNLDYAGVSL